MFFDEPLSLEKRAPKINAAAAMPAFVPQRMSLEEFSALPCGEPFSFDIEVYPNYFCVSFEHIETGKSISFELSPDVPELDKAGLSWVIWRVCLVGFNSSEFDLTMLMLALSGYSTETIKEASDAMILGDERSYKILKRYGIEIPPLNHIDLIEVAPLQASLKAYAARLHAPRLQALPFDAHTELTREQAQTVLLYNLVDLVDTSLLYKELKSEIVLREALGREYRQDLRSHSDAQIAEAVIASELAKLTGRMPRRPKASEVTRFAYRAPAWVRFDRPALGRVLDAIHGAMFDVDGAGSPMIPDELKALKIEIGKSVYKIGIGGLHSCEKSAAHKADADFRIFDVDVASYYPRIILNEGLYPKHLGPEFLTVYQGLVDKRLRAKKSGDKKTADSIKITINGGFGKFGNQFSILYSPDLLLQVTITGQLALLMLIERLESLGFSVISGNTDGIMIKCRRDRYDELRTIVAQWEAHTGFTTEETEYAAVYSRDVNNYIAVKTDGTCKAKGVYSEKGSALNSVLSKNPEALICSDAVQALLTKGTPIAKTIRECSDIRRFVVVRNVKGGGVWNGQYLGKVVRYYYGKDSHWAIQMRNSGNKVALSDGAFPAMDLPTSIPDNLNFAKYEELANEILYDIGFYQRPDSGSLF